MRPQRVPSASDTGVDRIGIHSRAGRVLSGGLFTVAAVLVGCTEIDFVGSGGAGAGTNVGAGTNTGAGTNSGASGQGGAGGSQTGGEDCTNGVDDDGDTLADCADDDCGAVFVCSVPVDGWSEPARLRTPGEACDVDETLAIELVTAFVPVDNVCACSCGTTCDPAEITIYSTPSCNNVKGNNLMSDGECWKFNDNASGLRLNPSPTNCTGKSSGLMDSTVNVARQKMCVPSGGGAGCAQGSCQPRPLCVYQPGVVACPPEYPVLHDAFTDYVDARSCSAASCGDCVNPNAPCDGTLTRYDDGTCQNGATDTMTIADGGCTPVVLANGQSLKTDFTVVTGCTSAGTGTMSGAVTGVGETTVCCAE